jgi:hypothetical protein
MAFQLSPGINISEIDLTNVTPAVATTEGAIAGVFRWGPTGERILVTSEKELVSRCGTKPIAEHLFQFHADAFRKNPSDEKFNELYAFMITLQAMDV